MKRTYTTWACGLALGLTLSTGAIAQNGRNCGTMEVLDRQMKENPDLAARMQELERHTAQYVGTHADGRTDAVNVTIPVVVHVVYNTTAQNIPDAQIQSQIDVLNKDYSKTNPDAANTPSLFAGLASSMNIQFCLAKTDPSGNTTTGIIRKSTTKASFSSNDGVKKSSTGGDNAWDASKYLNIWVCNLGGGLLGYAQFPGGAAATDGVVILYSAFGNSGSANAPYNLGRSATHEVGHWLNLRHIWGDATCGDDLVNDTPTQNTSNFGCPTFPHSTCSNTSDMFMNYMDYVDDACMYMFSAGQVARSQALFATGGARTGFLTSTACTAGTTPPPSCTAPTGLGATSITQTGATISWTAVSSATSYNVTYGVSGGTQTATTSTGTSLSLSGLTAGTTYTYSVAAVCSSGTSTATAGSFTTSSVTTVTYCANAGGIVTDEWIAYVGLGSIANTSGGSTGYQDFTSLSTNLLPGSSYTMTYKNGFASSTYTEYWRVWIDYNRDGDFLDAGETVFSRSSASTANLTSAFTVPSTATLGKTRMRVSLKYGSYLGAACTGYGSGWGQVEDYSIILGSGTGRAAANPGFAVEVAPNPASEMGIVNATLPEGATEASVRLLDLSGKQVWHADAVQATNARLESFGVPVQDLKPGFYLIQVEAAGQRKTVRLAVE